MKCFLCGITLSSHNASDVKESACKRCYPVYGGGVKEASKKIDFPDTLLNNGFKTPIHHAKKNISRKVHIEDYIDKSIGVRYY